MYELVWELLAGDQVVDRGGVIRYKHVGPLDTESAKMLVDEAAKAAAP